MTKTIILVIIWALSCMFAFIIGLILHYLSDRNTKPSENRELTQEEKRKIENEQREIMNFWTYNGDEQSQ